MRGVERCGNLVIAKGLILLRCRSQSRKKQITLFMKCAYRESGADTMIEQLFSVVNYPRRAVMAR